MRRNLVGLTRYLRRMRRFLDEVRPEVVHSNSLYSFAEAIAARRAGYPTLLHIHDMPPPGRGASVARWITRSRVDDAIAVSGACAGAYRADEWMPEVVYESAPLPSDPVRIRPRRKPFVIGMVGAMAARKGGDIFVAAARILPDDGSVSLRMVGAASEPLEREWGRGVIEAAKGAGIQHLDEADVEAEMRTWDALALPSRVDPCPLVMLEAMALGLPVIGTRVDGIPEQVTPECGLLVAPEDPDGLATAMLELAAMPKGQRATMGEVGRERVASLFSPERQAAGIERAYRRAIAARGGGGE
jgi:glycosyltransferase involved in cell wall biosynthesis